MDRYRRQLLEWWGRWQALSFTRKLMWAGGAFTVLAVTGILWWAVQPEYRALYAGLSVDEAGAITSKLQSKGISFRLTAGGTTILVPADQVMQIHLDMNNEGVPGSGKLVKGWDIFDQSHFGATPMENNVAMMRALQTELARTIMQIDPIIFARVHIVRPETSPFIRDKKVPTASVMIKTRPGTTLSHGTVDGIAALVSGSLEGMAKENVSIIDGTSNGRLLTKSAEGDGGMGSLVEQKKEMEQYLSGEAERMLTAVLGQGKAVVVVRADLDNKHVHETRTIINADGKVAKMEKTTTNKTNSNTQSKGGGPPGVGGNSGKASQGAGSGGSTTSQETQESDYDYPRTIQEWQNKLGAIERLTIASFVDLTGADKGFQIEDVTETIKKAVGFKASRDEIKVTQVKMPTPNSEGFDEEWATHQRWQDTLTLVRNGSMAMMGLCALPIFWFVFRRRASKPGAATEPQAEPAKLRLISDELERNPEALAKLLTSWMDRSETADKKAA